MLQIGRISLRLILLLAILVGNLTAAAAQTAHALMPVGTEIVICATEGERLVVLDANGIEIAQTPLGTAQCDLCSDCCAQAAFDLPALLSVAGFSPKPASLVVLEAGLAHSMLRQLLRARGPPMQA